MRISSFLAFSTLGLALVAGACRSDSNTTTDGNNTGDTGSNGGDVTIQQVQNDQMAPGTPVTLRGVVVTAIDTFGGKTGDIWVEEPDGGMFSGIHIFGATSTQVAALAVGDLVDVTGAVKDEFALTGSGGDSSGRTVTELKPATSGSLSVTKTGTGTVPAPVSVDALMIGQLADADTQGPTFSAAWEPYEGVLVSVNSVSALGGPKAFGSTGATDAYSFDITGVARVEGNFTDITMSGISRNTCLNLTGVVDYFFDYLVLPRGASDIDTSATGCPTAEATCADQIDNDGNGFADCNDDNCVSTDNTCRTTTTIATIDQAADTNPAMPTLPTGGVEIDNVFVTAIAGNNFWISSSATAAANSGLYVFAGGQPLPGGIVVGSKVNVIGRLQAYKARSTSTEVLPEVNLITVTAVTGTGTIQPSTQTATTLTATATGRPFVSSLVTISGLNKITAAQTSTNHYTGTLTNGATTYEFIGTIVQDANAVNKCYGAVEGIWTWDGYNNKYAILPTAIPPDGTGCP